MGFLKKIFLGFLILGATACTSLWDSDIGRPIKFGIAPNVSTRASYAEIAGGEIDWDPGDQVGIYMFWNGPGDQPRNAVYNVLPIVGSENYGKLSIDSRTSVSLTWQGYFKDRKAVEYEHTFISSHPPTDFDPVDSSFVLNTDQLFLTCFEKGIQSGTRENGDVVFLHYYPAVTTLVVTIRDTSGVVENGTFSIYGENLTGSYWFKPRTGFVAPIETQPVASANFEADVPLMMFLIPVQHPPNTLTFKINDSEWVVDRMLEARKKYVVTIDITKKEPEIEEPVIVPPTGSDLDAVTAQIILCYFRVLADSGYAKFESYWKEYFGYNSSNDFGNAGSWYRRLEQSMNSSNWVETINTLFSDPPAKEGALNAILEEIWKSNITELSIDNGSSQLKNSFTATTKLSKFFPNLQSLKLQIDNQTGFAVHLTDFDSLKVEIGGNNGDVTIYVAKGSNITVTNAGGNKITIVEVEVNKT